MSDVGDPTSKYHVSCDSGAIYLYTDDLDEAFAYAAELNERGPGSLHEQTKKFLGEDLPDPGRARVLEEAWDEEFRVHHWVEVSHDRA